MASLDISPSSDELRALLAECKRYGNNRARKLRFSKIFYECGCYKGIPEVYRDPELLEACCIYVPSLISDLPVKFRTYRLYQAAIKVGVRGELMKFPWAVLSQNMQSVVLMIGRCGASMLPRRSSRYTRFFVINELCKFIEMKFMLSNPCFLRILDQHKRKYSFVGTLPFHIIGSFLGTSEKDETFIELAHAFRPKNNKLFKYHFSSITPFYLRTEENSLVEKYARLISELERSTSQFSVAKDNNFIRRMIEERRKTGAFIFDFCE